MATVISPLFQPPNHKSLAYPYPVKRIAVLGFYLIALFSLLQSSFEVLVLCTWKM